MEQYWDNVVDALHSVSSEEEELQNITEESVDALGDMYENIFDPQEISDNISEIVSGAEEPIEELNNRLSDSLNMEDALNNLRDNMQEVNTVTEEGTVIENQRQASTANLISTEQGANLVLAQRVMAEQGLSLEEQQLLLNEAKRLASESAILTAEGQRIVQDTTLTEVERQQKLEELQLAMSKEALTTESMKATIALIDQKLATGQLVTAEELAIQTTYKNILALKQQETQSKLTAAALSLVKTALNMIVTSVIVYGITLIAKKIDEVIHKAEKLAEEAQKARERIDGLKKTMDDNSKTANSLKKRYAELAQGVDKLGTAFQNQGSLSTEDYEEFLDISNQLAELYPQLTKGYTDNKDAILELSGSANTIVKALDDVIERTRQITRMQINEEMTAVWDDDIKTLEEYNNELSNVKTQVLSFGVTEQRGSGYEDYLKTYQHLLDLINHSATKNLSLTEDLTKQEQELISEALKALEIEGVNFRAGTDAKGPFDSMTIFNFGKFGPEISQRLRKYFSDQIKEYEGYIYQTEDKIAQINARMKNNLVDYLSGDAIYLGLDKANQQVVLDILNNFDINSIPNDANVKSWDDLTRWYQTNIIQAIENVNDKEIQKKLGEFLSGEGTLKEAEKLYNEIYNYFVEMFGSDHPITIHLRAEIEEQQSNVDEALGVLLSNVSNKDERQQYAIGYRALLENQSDDFVNWVTGLEIPDGAIYSVQELLDMYDEWINKNKDLIESDPIPNIAKSVKDFTSDIKPWIDDLGNAYTSIFYGEDGFDIEAVNADLLEGIRSQFESIQQMFAEEYGIEEAFDTQALEKFLAVLSKDTTTVEEAQQAFNDYVTSLFYSAEGLKDLNKETADSIEQMMEQAGIINANEIVQQRVNADLEVQANREKALQAATEDANDTTMEATQAFLDEAGMCNLAKIQLGNLVATETVFNNTSLNVEDRINKLAELANAYLGAAAKAEFLNKVQNTAAGGHGTVDAATAWQQIIDQYSQLEYEPVKYKPTDTSSRKGGGGGSDSEEDPIVTAYEEAMDKLQFLRDNNFISEKEYYDQSRLLAEKFYGQDLEKYAEQYYNAIKDYLEGILELYKSAQQAAVSLLDAEIDKYNELEEKEKKVFEEEKEANEKKIKGLNKEIKLLDKEIKNLQKQQDTIRENDIKPLEDTIKERQKLVDSINEEVELMEKANEARTDSLELQRLQFEMERSQHQRANLIYTDDAGLGGAMKYRPDESAIRNNREALENKEYDLRVKAKREEAEIIEKEIDDLNKQIDEYEDKISAIDDTISGLEKEKEVLNDQIELIEEQNEALDEQIEKIESTYQKLIEGVESYKEAWEKIIKDQELATTRNALSMLGFDPDAIIALDEDTLEAFRTNMNAVLGSIYSENEGMMKELQTTLGSELGDYLSSTAPLFAELKTLDLTSVNTGIESAKNGVYQINDGFDATIAILQDVLAPTASETFEDITDQGINAATLIGAAAIEITDEIDQRISSIEYSIEGAISKAEELLRKLSDVKSKEAENSGSDTTVSAHASGTVGNAYADGYPGLPQSELALRSEYGQPELTVYPNGSYELTNSPTLSHLPKDTVIFNEEQTKRILRNGGISGKAYASGNATAKTLAEVMPEKAAIFERFEANLQVNIDSIKMNTYDISRNVADMAKAVINNTSYNGNTVTNNINITCPGVTEAEVARNMGPLVEQAFTNIFSGMSLGANQRAMRR